MSQPDAQAPTNQPVPATQEELFRRLGFGSFQPVAVAEATSFPLLEFQPRLEQYGYDMTNRILHMHEKTLEVQQKILSELTDTRRWIRQVAKQADAQVELLNQLLKQSRGPGFGAQHAAPVPSFSPTFASAPHLPALSIEEIRLLARDVAPECGVSAEFACNVMTDYLFDSEYRPLVDPRDKGKIRLEIIKRAKEINVDRDALMISVHHALSKAAYLTGRAIDEIRHIAWSVAEKRVYTRKTFEDADSFIRAAGLRKMGH